jgi:hypothetical protein
VVLGIQKVFKLLRMLRRYGQRQTHELGLRGDTKNGLDHRVIDPRVGFRRHVVLELDFVQHLPVGNGIVIAGLVSFAGFVGKSALRVPGEKTAVVVANLFHAGIP